MENNLTTENEISLVGGSTEEDVSHFTWLNGQKAECWSSHKSIQCLESEMTPDLED